MKFLKDIKDYKFQLINEASVISKKNIDSYIDSYYDKYDTFSYAIKNIVNKYGFKSEILAYWNSEQAALDHEKLLISCFKDMGYKLANKADGGEVNSGWKHSESYKEFMKNVNKGKVVSAKTKEKLRIAALNRPKRIISEAHKEKNRIALTGRKYSAESLKKMSDAKKLRDAKNLVKKESL